LQGASKALQEENRTGERLAHAQPAGRLALEAEEGAYENPQHLQSRPAGATVHSLEGLRTVLGTAGEHLGDMVWWTLADASLDRVTLEARWTGAGLAKELLPEPPTAEKARVYSFLPARLRWADDQGGGLGRPPLRLHLPGDGRVVPRLLEVYRDGELSLRFTSLKADTKGALPDKLF